MSKAKTMPVAEHNRVTAYLYGELDDKRRRQRAEALSTVLGVWPSRSMEEAFKKAEKLDRWLRQKAR